MKAVAIMIALGLATASVTAARAFDLEGHRGARGLMPENTLPAFAKALTIGVTTLELDTGITRDGQVVISHDRVLNPATTRAPDGHYVDPPTPRIRDLTLAELQRFDVGRINPDSAYAKSFPKQQAVDGTHFVSLKELFALVRKSGNQTVRFNIETKLSPLAPEETVSPEIFVKTLVALIRAEGMAKRAMIQSFDWRTLQLAQKQAPEMKTVYLTLQRGEGDTILAGKPGVSPWTAGFDIKQYGGSVPRMVKAAGGAVWSPYYKDMNRAQLREAQGLGLEVVVWTVNDPAEMADLIEMGVDGIITDYPDRLRDLLARRDVPLPPSTPVVP